jgi:hypothetical protein
VSHYFYVRRSPWHPEFPVYSRLSLDKGLIEFSHKLLPEFAEWVRSWHENRDAQLSRIITYEDLLSKPVSVFSEVAKHFRLDSSSGVVERIVEENSFRRLSKGRVRGEEKTDSFFRKGIIGDWRNHFTTELREIYKREIGEFLIEFGYEKDFSW